MKVKDLIEQLLTFDQESLVLVSSDPEGNRIRGLDYVGEEQGVKDGYEWELLDPEDYDDYPERVVTVLLSP